MNSYKSIAEDVVKKKTCVLQDSLQLLAAAKKEQYYDLQQDQLNKKNYYKNIQIDSPNEKEKYQQLSALLKKTHTTILSYDDARHKYLYTRVDLQPNKRLKSIYSGEEYSPETVIANDFEIATETIKRAGEQFAKMATMDEATFLEHLASLEADATYNTEHTVPQSWFAKRYPMKGDLHHLFTCETACNEFRGNLPFFDFPDFEDTVKKGCGKKGENKFEPSQGNGTVARATLYFLLRYPGEINNNPKEYTKDKLQILLKWHKEKAVSEYELHRNAEIFKVQGNRNPLIDHPEWGTKLNFALGLG